jgi:hypothetical protein
MTGGSQARRERWAQLFGLVLIVFCGLLMLGMIIWLLAAKPSDLDGGERLAIAAILAPFALVFFGLAWYILRKLRPAVAKHLRVEVASPHVRRGDRVSATLTVTRPPAAEARVELALVCTERYDVEQRVTNPNGADYDQRATRSDDVHREAIPITGPGPHRIDFTVPTARPFSYEGDCISAAWRVEALERRQRRTDRAAKVAIWVAP